MKKPLTGIIFTVRYMKKPLTGIITFNNNISVRYMKKPVTDNIKKYCYVLFMVRNIKNPVTKY